MVRNAPHACDDECPLNAQRAFICSDSSDEAWGTVSFSPDGSVLHERGGVWTKSFATCHIFLKEMRAAVEAALFALESA